MITDIKFPMIVGEMPSQSSDPLSPFDPWLVNQSGDRLRRYTGLEPIQFSHYFGRNNLIFEYENKWSLKEAKKTARYIISFAVAHASKAHLQTTKIPKLGVLYRPADIFICGRRAAAAFGLMDREFYKTKNLGFLGARATVIPHPSGQNRWYNDPANVRETIVFWDNYIQRVTAKDFSINKQA